MRARRERRSRHGLAVVLALGVMTVISILVAAALYLATRSRNAVETRVTDAALTTAADYVLWSAVSSWPAAVRAAQVPAAADTISLVPPSSVPISGSVHTIRLTETVFSLVSTLQSPRVPGVARRVGLLVRIPLLSHLAGWPIVSAGDIYLGPAAQISQEPTGAIGSCSGLSAGADTVVLAPGAQLQSAPNRTAGPVTPVVLPAAGALSTYLNFGGISWDTLAARATLQVPSGGTLAAGPAVLVHGAGDVTLTSGIGSGVLLVDGRLRLQGPLTYSGVIVARHGIEALTDGVTLTGVLMSAATDADSGLAGTHPVSLNTAMQVRGSRCQAVRAYAAASQPRQVRQRAFSELWD